MGKTIILNLSNVKLSGNILDVGENFGIIYNLSKDIMDEISIDYVGSETKYLLQEEEYDTCTVFFHLSRMWSNNERQGLIDELSRYIKVGGELLVWDINKEIGKVTNNKIAALLPSGKIKEFDFKNLNPVTKSDIDETKIMLEKFYKIEETKLWEDIHFIKARKV